MSICAGVAPSMAAPWSQSLAAATAAWVPTESMAPHLSHVAQPPLLSRPSSAIPPTCLAHVLHHPRCVTPAASAAAEYGRTSCAVPHARMHPG